MVPWAGDAMGVSMRCVERWYLGGGTPSSGAAFPGRDVMPVFWRRGAWRAAEGGAAHTPHSCRCGIRIVVGGATEPLVLGAGGQGGREYVRWPL